MSRIRYFARRANGHGCRQTHNDRNSPPASMGEQMTNMINCMRAVTIHDLNDTAHSVDVTRKPYDAVAQAIVALRGREWVGEIGRSLATATVMVRQPEILHTIKIQDF